MSIEELPRDLVSDLARAEAYPDDPSACDGVEQVQTHLSHLFLTRARVVKLRKPVALPFVDFSLRASRVADCHHEVALNRRLAPDVYLGVAAVERGSGDAGHFVVRDRWLDEVGSASGAQPECVVVMRRLESGRDALSLLERGALEGRHLDAVANTLARFHDRVGLGCPAPWEPDAWWEHCFRPIADTLDSLAATRPDGFSAHDLDTLTKATHQRFEELRACLEERRRDGRAVDGHGDVHLQHVWFEPDTPGPVLIDCVEFEPKLRRIDAASEVAFLAMDLSYRGRPDLAARFLRRYATERDDFGLFEVVDAYQSYRAGVRAKVAALAAVDARIAAEQRKAAQESACRHLALATKTIDAKPRGALVLVCGTVGVGKSSVAEELAERARGVVISSDRTRKRMAGIAADTHVGEAIDAGLYAPERTDAVYGGLLDRAVPVVSSGRVAILDATFGRVELRERARRWAAQRDIDVVLVQVRCRKELVLERIRRRSELGRDPSDAGPEFVDVSRSRFEPPEEWPAEARYEARTDVEPPADSLAPLIARLGVEA